MVSDTSLIACQRDLFDIPREVVWLNCAYMSPLSKAAAEAGRAAIARRSQPWNIGSRHFFEETERVRALFAGLIGADADGVAIVPSVSYGISVAARNLHCGPRRDIVVLEHQFPSNFYAWQRLAGDTNGSVRVVRRAEAARPGGGIDWTSALLAAIGTSTAVVALPNCLWTDGSLVDLDAVSRAAREHGAALVLDLTQSAGALPFDAARIRPDFAVAAAYKWLLGPYSLAFLYVAPQHRGGVPLEENWISRKGSEDFTGLVDYANEYQPGARRFDMGERSSFHLMPIAEQALIQLLQWDVARISETLGSRNREIARRAGELGLEVADERDRAPHYLGLRCPGGMPDGLHARLAANDIHVSVRGDSIRVTPHLWNDDDDVEKFLVVLREILTRRGA